MCYTFKHILFYERTNCTNCQDHGDSWKFVHNMGRINLYKLVNLSNGGSRLEGQHIRYLLSHVSSVDENHFIPICGFVLLSQFNLFCSWAAVAPVKYEYDSKNLTGIFVIP